MKKTHAAHEAGEVKRVVPDIAAGLNAAQVEERMRRGAHNAPMPSLTRSGLRIVRDNVFTLFNLINAGLAVLIISVGRYENLLFLGVAISNTLIGIYQEMRAKRNIDRLSIITQAKVTVVREGERVMVESGGIVLDDIMLVQSGNQICADGIVVKDDGLEVDESALTGESRPVRKRGEENVLSGSFAVAGSATVRVTAVGGESFAWKLSSEAKRDKKPTSELMRSLNAIIKTLTVIIIPLGVALFVTQQAKGMGFEASVLGAAAAMIGMIPEGLVLLTGVALAVGVINLAKRQTLVQCMPCIETLARVDVLCLDKTGTITDGSLSVSEVVCCDGSSMEHIHQAVAAVVHSLKDNNATALALKAYFTQDPGWPVTEKSPFSSQRKWSGCAFGEQGAFKLGAPEFLDVEYGEWGEKIKSYSEQGLRVLALTHSDKTLSHAGTLMAILTLSDHIRPEAQATFAFFEQQGVGVKVISGDNAQTVSGIALRAGVKDAGQFIDMCEAGDGDYAQLVHRTVFGRVSPHQKQKLVKAMQQAGHVVAMTGDGVNDVLALRDADCSIAMASGSDAARDISDIVLLTDNFDAMTHVVLEGRRVVNNIERVASLFLVKTAYSTLLTLLFIFLPLQFPFQPIQLSPTSMLTVGIPAFFLALKPSYQRLQGKFMRNVLKISLPGAFCILVNILLIQWLGPALTLDYEQTSTLCVFMTGVYGFVVLAQVARPLDRARAVMLGLLGAAFAAIYFFFGRFFSLASMFSPLAWIYVPLLLLAYPLFRAASRLSLRAVRALRKLRVSKRKV